ncbi:Ig-like domain-containing protein [Actinoplanes sp. NPDC049548]|uniref:Ig-like domain-containing protein n=1 Tax=Actinoplanes sp. NPDC049548 TaxID=3155152 RepID=UPI00342138CD
MHRRRTRTSPRRALALLLAVLVAAVSALVLSPSANADVTTPFAKRFGVNTNGGIVLRGNTLLTCRTADTGCTAAQAGGGANTNNDNYEMRYVNVDPDGVNFNSSSSTLSLSPGSTVLYAALYWSGDTESATNTQGNDVPIATPSVANKNKVRFKVPGGSYTTVTASRVDSVTAIAQRDFYQGVADVTSLVAGAGNGVYTVGNVQATQNDSRYAGWALVVAYRNPADPMRNLTIFDGFGYINNPGTPSVDITVSGFETPPTGTVKSKIGTVVYEGDLGITGDALKLDGTTLSDAANPATNYFNSTISDGGVLDTARNPNFSNLMAVDIDTFSTTTALANGATDATLNLSTSGDTFYPGVVTMATDLFAPDVKATVTPTDLNGGQVKPGDVIEYTVDLSNQGNDGATDLVVTDAIPTGTVYVPGSLKIGGAGRTDAAGDDQAEMQGSTVTVRVGTGADGSSGGAMAVGATATVKFRVRVDPDTPGGFTITNVATVADKGASSNPPLSLSGTSNISTLTVTAAATDLAVTGSVTPGTVQKGGADDPVGYDLSVINNGPDTQLTSVLTLTLPSGVTPSGGTASAGSCSVAGQVVTCAIGTVATGATVTAHIDAVADGTAADPSNATAAVSGKYTDAPTTNNSATIALAANRQPVAGADSGTTTNGVAVTRSVLGNDSDPDGDALHVQSVTTPAHGGAVVNGDNTITYTPDAGFKGPEAITYTLADARGGTTTGTLTVTVANAGPTAVADITGTPAKTAATIDVAGNDTDPNDDTLTVTAVGQPAGGAATGTVVDNHDGTVTFTPSASFGGTATFTYTISDGDGGTAGGTVTVDVANQLPTAADDDTDTPYHTDVTVDVRDNDTDPNNDTLTVTGVTTPVDGDGTQRGTADSNGTQVTYHPPVGFSGTVTFTYTVSDGNLGTDTATVTIEVGNALPAAVGDAAHAGYHQAVGIDVLGNDGDPNGDTLSVTSAGPAGNGTVTLENDGTLTYTPDAGFSGDDTFSYTASDGHGGTDTGTVTVTVDNAVPTAAGDPRTIEADNPVSVPVLLNDSDENTTDVLVIDSFDAASVEGGTVVLDDNGTPADASDDRLVYTPPAGFLGVDTFTYVVRDGHGGTDDAVVTITVQNTAPVAAADAAITPTDTFVVIPVLGNDTDAGHDTLTVSATTGASYGTVATNGTTVTYTPDEAYFGTDTFTYTISDGRGGFDTATVTVTVQNAPPVAHPDAQRAEPGVATVIDVLHNDTDANHHALAVSATTQGSHGTVSVAADGSEVTYTSAPGHHGPDSFTYTVSDGNGGTATGTVTITVNAAPVPGNDTSAETGTGQAVLIPVLGNDTDAENDPITVTAGPAAPQHGTITVQPDGSIRYTPDPGYAGPDSFGYTVSDPAGGSNSATVTVDVANAVPVATDDAGTSTAPQQPVDVPVLLNDTDANVGAGGQLLTVTAVTQPGHGKVTIKDAGTITYEPGKFKGTDTFTYTVSDGKGGTDTATVTVTVDNAAPVAGNDHDDTDPDTPVTIDVLVNDGDPNGDALTVTSLTAPRDADDANRGTVTTDGTTVTYNPPDDFHGQVTFGYTVKDDEDLTDTALVTVDVANSAPVALDDTGSTPYQQPVSVAVLDNDADPNGDDLTVTSWTRPKDRGNLIRGTVAAGPQPGTLVYTPSAGFSGLVNLTYTVSDGYGGTAKAVVRIEVAPAPAVPDKAVKSAPGAPSTVPLPLLDDNGRAVQLIGVSQPRHGTVRINPDNTVTYTPKPGFAGEDTFRYTVRDEDGNLATAIVHVKVAAAPKAPDDAVQAKPGAGTTVDVLDQATDADGDKLTLIEVGTPRHGTVTMHADGTVTYVPDKGYVGADSFTYTVTDTDGNTSTGTITVSVKGSGTLAKTGDDVAGLALYGAAIVVAGAALLLLGTVRRRTPAMAAAASGRHRRR